MLIDFLSDSKFNKFINFMDNIFSSVFFWIFIFFIISILIRISFLKTKSIKNINNNFNKLKFLAFISNVLILIVVNVFIHLSLIWVTTSTVNLLNFIFLSVVIFFSTTRARHFNFIILFNKLIAIFFLIAFASDIFNFIFYVFLKTKNNLFYLICLVIAYVLLISTIIVNNNVTELKQIFQQLFFGVILLLLFLILNLAFIANSKDIKLSTIFNNIFIVVLLWNYILYIILISKNKTNLQHESKNKEDLKFFILAIKNNILTKEKPLKFSTIFINGYKQVMII